MYNKAAHTITHRQWRVAYLKNTDRMTTTLLSAAIAIPCQAIWNESLSLVTLMILLIGICVFIAIYINTRLMHTKMEEQKARLERQHSNDIEDLKRTVLSTVSQELLTPMTLIVGPLQQMVAEPMPEEQRTRVQILLRNAQILLHQINMLPSGMKPSESTIMAIQNMTTPAAAQPYTTTKPKTDADNYVDDTNAASAIGKTSSTAGYEDGEENHRFTMLMVDDSEDMCRFVRDYFRGEYNVITAHDGEEGLKLLQENDGIDLVVSDVTMPNMNGLELCKEIKSDLRWSHIPVILLTGITGNDTEVKGLKLGADDYITKPFNVEMLRLRVKKLIEKKENRQKQFREKANVTPSEITITSVDEKFIQLAMKICEDHMSDTDFNVEVLGQELSLSRTYLYKKLINITGKGPAEFIRTIRMKKAKQYLEQSQMQIADIATSLGYSSPKRFTENFRAEYGIVPSEYLRRTRTGRAIRDIDTTISDSDTSRKDRDTTAEE